MPRMRFVHSESIDRHELVGEGLDDTGRQRVAQHDVRVHHPGAADELQLWEISMQPDVEVPGHAHETSEIVYVLDGDITFGARRCTAGSSVLIPAETLYSFRVGGDGCRFLLFRAQADESYINKADFRRKITADPRACD